MARPPKPELRPAELRCLDNDHRFAAEGWHLEHYVAGSDEPVLLWVVETTEGVTCPFCGSRANSVKD
jgi:hypothetical protein